MNIQAIVYTSNTGYTAAYAKMLGEKTGKPVYTLEEAKKNLAMGSEIVYLGWLMASAVKGYPEAAKQYRIAAVCGVCLGATGSQIEEVRKVNGIPADLPVFTLQGGFDMARLKGIYKLMMKMMRKALKKQIGAKEQKTADDLAILQMLDEGGSAVDERHLAGILALLQ